MHKNGQKIISSNDIKIEEFEFHLHKSLISIKDRDINKIVISNKPPFNKQKFKCFIGYNRDLEGRRMRIAANSSVLT